MSTCYLFPRVCDFVTLCNQLEVGHVIFNRDVVWDACSESDSNLLESLQIEGARVVAGALKGTRS